MNRYAGLFLTGIAFFAAPIWAGTVPAPTALPGSGFNGDRYTNLWTKSPFAIATVEAPAASEDYQLVGLAQFDGISYVSLVDKQSQNQEHFVLSSDKPLDDPKRNLHLKLVSVVRSATGLSAVIQRNGESLTLRQDPTQAPAAAPANPMPNGLPVPPPGMVPSPNPSVGGMIPTAGVPRRAQIHHFIRVPPPPPSPPPSQ